MTHLELHANQVPLRSTVTSISQLQNSLRSYCENGILLRNWHFVAKLKLTLRLPFFLFTPVICAAKRVSKIRAPFSQPVRLLHQASPSKPPVISSDQQRWPKFDSPKWHEHEGLSLHLLRTARRVCKRSQVQVLLQSLRRQGQILLR